MTATWLLDQPTVAVMAALHAGVLGASAPFVRRRPALRRLPLALLMAAFAANTWVIANRWVVADRAPFKTLYETLLFYPWCIALVVFMLVAVHRLEVLAPFASIASLLGLGYALGRPDAEVVNLPPALQSGWFVPHVVTYFFAYAALFASFVLAALALAAPRPAGGRPAEAGAAGVPYERHAHQAALFGLSALTLGLVMGAVWAKYAWGDYWSWDPKENWALVSWLAYAIYVHLRHARRWEARPAMWVLAAAFGAVVFTYFGMSLLPTAAGSLHVYQ